MAIIVNGVDIPTTGNNIKYGNTDITKVNVVKNGITTTVWEKQVKITPPISELTNYVSGISSDTDGVGFSTCSDHYGAPKFSAEIWDATRNCSVTKTTIIAPKEPYTKIKCDLHIVTRAWNLDDASIKINGVKNTADVMTIGPVSSFEIEAKAEVNRYSDPDAAPHYVSSADVCIYNVELS